jgi:hypothetical protein
MGDHVVQCFMINLESMNASKIRSVFNDSDIVSLTVSVNGIVTGNITKDLGDLGSGNYAIGMYLPAIAPADGSVQFSFLIVNAGFDRSNEKEVKRVMNTLSDKSAQLCAGVFGYKDVWDRANKFHTNWLRGILFVDWTICDGAVAGDAFSFPVSTLQSVAAQGHHTERYPGSDSPHGCGENSLYFVDWSLRPLSPEEISNIVAQARSQFNWQWCNKCQGLAYAGNPTMGACPAGGQHDHTGSGNYRLLFAVAVVPGQDNWRWCNKCQGLAYAGNPTMGACPAGGQHDHTGSGNYVLQNDLALIPGQDNWQWCNKCQGLAYAGNPTVGACPAGGQHDHTGSGNYTLIV